MKGRRISAALCVLAFCLLFASPALATKYVALGDSYSSGTGTRTFYESTCQRSIYAYPYLLHNAHPEWTFVNATCSGAKTGRHPQHPGQQRHLGHQLGHLHDRRQRRRFLQRDHRLRAAVVGVELRRGDQHRPVLHRQHAAGPARPGQQCDQVAGAERESRRPRLPAPVQRHRLQRPHLVQRQRDDAAQPDGRPAEERAQRGGDAGGSELRLPRRDPALHRPRRL